MQSNSSRHNEFRALGVNKDQIPGLEGGGEYRPDAHHQDRIQKIKSHKSKCEYFTIFILFVQNYYLSTSLRQPPCFCIGSNCRSMQKHFWTQQSGSAKRIIITRWT